MSFSKKYFRVATFSLATVIGLTNQAFTAGSAAVQNAQSSSDKSENGQVVLDFGLEDFFSRLTHSGMSQSCYVPQEKAHHSTIAGDEVDFGGRENLLLLKKSLKFVADPGEADVLGKRLLKIAIDTESPIKAAGLLAYVIVDGLDDARQRATNALVFILSGANPTFALSTPNEAAGPSTDSLGGDGRRIPLGISLKAARKAFEAEIGKNTDSAVLKPLLRRYTNPPLWSIPQIAVQCFYSTPTEPSLMNLFNDVASNLSGDETLSAEIARRVL